MTAGGRSHNHSYWYQTLARLLHNRLAVVCLAIIVGLCVVAAIGPSVAPKDPLASNFATSFSGPSGDHWLGTDALGRDIFSRLIAATRVSMRASLEVVVRALVPALGLGLIAGFAGGKVDWLIMRLSDTVQSIPPLALALGLAGVLGPSLANAILALSIIFIPTLLRIVRAQALVVREEAYIAASRTIGSPPHRIIVHRVLPNIIAPVVVQSSLIAGTALLAEAGLSFLGVGQQPPSPSWGTMLRDAYSSMFQDQWLVFPPGIAIGVTVFAFNTLGDALRDALDTRPPARAQPIRPRPRVHSAADPAVGSQPKAEPSSILRVTGLSIDINQDRGLTTDRVVDDVNLTIQRSEIVGLVGESGSGKTVTAMSLLGILPPVMHAHGVVDFEGRNLLRLRGREFRAIRGRGIAMVFQNPMAAFDPSFTVGSQLAGALRYHETVSRATAHGRAVEALAEVGIRNPQRRAHDYPHMFSGGMLQRASIAMALIARPKLLIADEVTTALDVSVQARILDLLHDLRSQRELAILLVTHDLGVVADVCDRVAVMYAGEIVEEAQCRTVLHEPRHPYTKALMLCAGDAVSVGGGSRFLQGRVPDPGAWPTGCRFADRCEFRVDRCTVEPVAVGEVSSDHLVRCIRSREPLDQATERSALAVDAQHELR